MKLAHHLTLARSENKELKLFNAFFKDGDSQVTRDRNFHHDVDGERSWDMGGVQIVRTSTLIKKPCIIGEREEIEAQYTVWVPVYTPATRMQPEEHDAEEVGKHERFEDALFSARLQIEQHNYRNYCEGEYWAEEAKREASGYYEQVWD